MPCILNASSFNNGLIQSADATGVLQLQSNGTTGLSIGTGGKVSLPNTALTTASAGTLEYDGRVPYFTPLGTQRGVMPGMQLYSLNSGLLGLNATGAQSVLGVGCTLSSSTIYRFDFAFTLVRSAGTTSHTVALGFAGTATLNNISYNALTQWTNSVTTATPACAYVQTAASTVITLAFTTQQTVWVMASGVVSVNSGGTFIPQYTLSAAPGGAYTTQTGSFLSIYPVAAAGSNVSVGTWA